MHFLSNIVKYSYSPGELRKHFRPQDLWDYGITRKELEAKLQEFSNSFLSSNCAINGLNTVNLGDTHIFCPASVQDTLCLRRTNHIVKKALRTPILNRDDEVKQLLQVLAGETKCNIFRTDIKSFFESVPLAEIIAKLESDGLRNNSALTHLKNLNSLLQQSHNLKGLPRGLAISSTLADYALQSFDRDIFNCDSVVYFTRYVDDICIVHFANQQDIKALVEKHLPYNLKLNANKTQTLELPSTDSLEFLGYRIELKHPQSVSVADGKIGKAKKRIVLSLKAFLCDQNFELLFARLRFLSCSTQMKKVGRKAPVYTGYRHVYRLCDNDAITKQLKNLDAFLHGIINSRRYTLGRSLNNILSGQQRKALRSVSFEKCYVSNLTVPIRPRRISEIKQAWQYE